MIAAFFLILLGLYLALGILFAIPFIAFGVKRIDPHAAHGSWGFRVLILPGSVALWPLLMRRWASGAQEPHEECTAHRRCSVTETRSKDSTPGRQIQTKHDAEERP
jgi:hypothetical protein